MSRKVSWTLPGRRGTRVKPVTEKKVTVKVDDTKHETEPAAAPPAELKRKNTLTPRGPCIVGGTPQPGRRATIPNTTTIPNITVVETASV